MNAITSTQNLITCETTEEHSHPTSFTSVITSSPPVDNVSTMVQGVSGAVYAPMDTTPRPQAEQDNININLAVIQVTRALENLVTALRDAQPQAQPDLKDTIETTLQQANWFYDMVGQHIDENHDIESLVDDRVDDRIGSEVDEWLSYNLNINDHVDMDELVSDAVDAKLEDLVTEKLEQLLEEKLANATITVKL